MPKIWTKTEAFAHFGVELENVQWSWSGMSTSHGAVVVVLWQDGIKGRDANWFYHDDDELDAEWRNRIGNKRRIEHLLYARDHNGGRFQAVTAKALDVKADPRKIEKCWPQMDVHWLLEYLDDKTGAFRARMIR